MTKSHIFDVTTFGAVGDGIVDDGSFIDKAIEELSAAGGGVLYFPFGKYLTTTKHTISNVPCRIKGDGVGLSAVEWDTSDGGFEFKGGGFNGNYINSLHVSDLAFVTRKRLGGTALFMSWDDGNKSIIQHLVLENLQIKGAGLYAGNEGHMWTRGIHTQKAFNSVIRNVHIIGSTNVVNSADAQNTEALVLEKASGESTQFLISDFYANFYGTAFRFDNVEGIYMSNFELVLNLTGVKGNGVYVAIFSNGHIDYRNSGFIIENSSSVRITDCDIKHAPGGPGNAVSFSRCVDIGVSNCSIKGPGDKAGFHANGVIVGDYPGRLEHAIITGNSFMWFPDQAVWLQTDTRRNRVTNNTFEAIAGNKVLDQGTENVVD